MESNFPLEYHVGRTYHAHPPLHDWYMVRTTPPPLLLVVMVGLYIHTTFWAKVLQYPELQLHGPGTCIVWFSLHIIINYNIISLLHHALIKNKLSFDFKDFTMPLLVRSIGFLELFSNSPLECLWPLLMQSSLLAGHHENHLIWVDSMRPVSLGFCSFPPWEYSNVGPWLCNLCIYWILFHPAEIFNKKKYFITYKSSTTQDPPAPCLGQGFETSYDYWHLLTTVKQSIYWLCE